MQRSCECNFALWCDEPITYAAPPRNWLGFTCLRLDKALPAESGEGGVDAGSDRFVFCELGDVFGNRIAISAWFEGDGCEQNVQLQRTQYKRPPPHLRLARFDLGHFAYTAKNTSSRKYISRQMFVVSCQYRKTFDRLFPPLSHFSPRGSVQSGYWPDGQNGKQLRSQPDQKI